MNTTANGPTQMWSGIAAAYATYTSPFVPTDEDIHLTESAIERWHSEHRDVVINAALLGATPRLATMKWPDRSFLLGVDSSPDVINAIWPGNIAGLRGMACANWAALPLREGSCHIAVGDGSLIAFRYPDGFHEFARSVSRVLSDDGVLILRCYIQPEKQETVDQVFQALIEGRIGNVNQFKFCLFMALQPTAQEGVCVRDVYATWASRRIQEETLVKEFGWDRAAIRGMEMWRHSDTVYTFPKLAQMRSVLQRCFAEQTIVYPVYELGERCPTFVLTPNRPRRL
jgi:hypothetical protein